MFRNMAEADPENDMAHFNLGKICFEMQDFPEAERSLRKAIELNPGHAQARRYLGQMLAGTGRRDEAIAALGEAVSLAHERGEFAVRKQAQDALRSLGVEPPDPAREERVRRGIAEGQFACARCGLPNERLSEAPFDAPLGKKIHETICRACWGEWMQTSVRLINEYRLNLASDEGAKVFDFHMKEFLAIADQA